MLMLSARSGRLAGRIGPGCRWASARSWPASWLLILRMARWPGDAPGQRAAALPGQMS